MRFSPFLSSVPVAAAGLVLALSGAPAVAQPSTNHPAQPELSHRANKDPEARNTNPEGADETAKSTPMALGKADRAFMTNAAANGLFEMQAAKLAASQAKDGRVKEFAQVLQRDHAKASEGLQAVSREHNYPLPDRPAKDKQAVLDQLSTKRGGEFDSMFVRQVGIAAHEEDIKAFKRASRATRTPDLKEWIDRTLPTLEAHLKQAQELGKK